jgi:cell division protein FtsI (penicillin-binding protein 3)
VIFDDPKGSLSEKYGGVVAAPVFKEIAERTLKYRGRVGTEAVEPGKLDLQLVEEPRAKQPAKTIQTADAGFEPNQMPDLMGLSVRNALRLAEKRGLDITVIGSGIAVRQTPEPGTVLDKTKRGTVLFRPAS